MICPRPASCLCSMPRPTAAPSILRSALWIAGGFIVCAGSGKASGWARAIRFARQKVSPSARSGTRIGRRCAHTTLRRLVRSAAPCLTACADDCRRPSSSRNREAVLSAFAWGATGALPRTSVPWWRRALRSPAPFSRARLTASGRRSSSISPTPGTKRGCFWKRVALRRGGRSPACCMGAPCASTTPRAPSPWSGRSSDESEQFWRVDRRHLYALVEKLVGIGGPHVERLLHLQIFIDQPVVVGHARVVVPPKRHGARDLVIHQHGDEMPVIELVLKEERAVRFHQRLGAGLGGLDALRECLLRDLHELVGLVAVRLEPGAVGDDGVAVGVHAGVLPRQEAHVAAELARKDMVQIEE